MNKNGRPKSNDSKGKQYRIRMSDAEFDDLELLSRESKQSKADIMRAALRLYKVSHRNLS